MLTQQKCITRNKDVEYKTYVKCHNDNYTMNEKMPNHVSITGIETTIHTDIMENPINLCKIQRQESTIKRDLGWNGQHLACSPTKMFNRLLNDNLKSFTGDSSQEFNS